MITKKSYMAAMAIVLLALLQGCASTYSGASMRARVIDADTKLPLAGVVVVAHWQLFYPIFHGHVRRDIEILEAVTDQDGWFQLPAWGPLPIPAGMPSRTRMSHGVPIIILFRSGYGQQVTNGSEDTMDDKRDAVYRSRWDGKAIEIKRFEGSRLAYAESVGPLITGLNYPNCIWKKMPRMLIALDREAKQLDLEHIPHALHTLGHYESFNAGNVCGSAKAFFSGYEK
jgi:hypothetical protein